MDSLGLVQLDPGMEVAIAIDQLLLPSSTACGLGIPQRNTLTRQLGEKAERAFVPA